MTISGAEWPRVCAICWKFVEDRYNTGSLIIMRPLSANLWYELVGNPSLTDGILGRIVYNEEPALRKQTAAA